MRRDDGEAAGLTIGTRLEWSAETFQGAINQIWEQPDDLPVSIVDDGIAL